MKKLRHKSIGQIIEKTHMMAKESYDDALEYKGDFENEYSTNLDFSSNTEKNVFKSW